MPDCRNCRYFELCGKIRGNAGQQSAACLHGKSLACPQVFYSNEKNFSCKCECRGKTERVSAQEQDFCNIADGAGRNTEGTAGGEMAE